jgi:hypothetical protein
VLGGGAALIFVGGIGRNRSDPQQSEQTLDAVLEIPIYLAQDGIECAHLRSPGVICRHASNASPG